MGKGLKTCYEDAKQSSMKYKETLSQRKDFMTIFFSVVFAAEP